MMCLFSAKARRGKKLWGWNAGNKNYDGDSGLLSPHRRGRGVTSGLTRLFVAEKMY